MQLLTKPELDLNVIHANLKKIDPSIILFRGYGVTNFYSEKNKFSIGPYIDMDNNELIFEVTVPNGAVGNEVFKGSPSDVLDWVRENFDTFVSMSNFENGRVGTRDEYLTKIGENPADADSFEPTAEADEADFADVKEIVRPEIVRPDLIDLS